MEIPMAYKGLGEGRSRPIFEWICETRISLCVKPRPPARLRFVNAAGDYKAG